LYSKVGLLLTTTCFGLQVAYTLHYNPRHISSNTVPIFRTSNYILTASGIVTLCKRLYSMPDESRLQSALNRYTN